MAITARDTSDMEFTEHVDTYRGFLRYSFLFAAHVLVILALLAYFLV